MKENSGLLHSVGRIPRLVALALCSSTLLVFLVFSSFYAGAATAACSVLLWLLCRRRPLSRLALLLLPLVLVVVVVLLVLGVWLVWLAGVGGVGGRRSSEAVKTISVILACANEGEFAAKTARSFFETTPAEVLREVVVVDDGSAVPLEGEMSGDFQREKETDRLVFVRHERHTGLINAKAAGAEKARGDALAFFDCHVKPRKDWEREILELLNANERRIVVPTITSVEATTWEEIPGEKSGQLSKCYLTWDADFRWFRDETSDDVPILSGGLLVTTRFWWRETQGYDRSMQGWGAENIDQSLRSWLCGGDIVHAKSSFVAHMWRVNHKPETKAKYSVPAGSVTTNRRKVIQAWLGPWSQKITQYPDLNSGTLVNTDNIDRVKTALNCKPFSAFLERFASIYVDAGLLPEQVFHIRDIQTGLCLTNKLIDKHQGQLVATQCSDHDSRQLWHRGNRWADERRCCSGLRNWNSNLCASKSGNSHECDISGNSAEQQLEVDLYGRLVGSGNSCLSVSAPGGEQIATETASEDCMHDFRVFRVDDRYIQVISDSLCLQVTGSRVELGSCEIGSSNQHFRSEGAEVNHVVLKTRLGGLCLTDGGNFLKTAACDASAADQRFRLPSENHGPIFSGRARCLARRPTKAESFAVALRGCTAEGQLVKAGQGLQKVKFSESSYALQEGDFCLKSTSSSALRVTRCPPEFSKEFLWSDFGADKIFSVAFNSSCIDANDNKFPILYPCYAEENTNQEWRAAMDDGRLIRNARSSLCLDFKPEEDVSVKSGPCDDRKSRWEIYRPFVPLETQLFTSQQKIHV